MAKSLSRILGQIEKLQKEAAAIQTGVIARIRKEISDHGLTAEHLFGKSSGATVGDGTSTKSASAKKGASKKKAGNGASRPPKFADGNGNIWGGMGKRPDWIRSALAAGKALEEFLIGGKKTQSAAKKPNATSKASAKSTSKVARKASGARTKASPPTAGGRPPATKPAAKKTPPAKRAVAKAAGGVRKGPSKKTVAKRKQAAPAQNASGASA